MSGQKALGDGSIIDIGTDPHDVEMDALRMENRRLRRELSDAQVETERAREDANRALGALRRQLSPLYLAMQAVFGELDAANITDAPSEAPRAAEARASETDPRIKAVWDSWKSRLPPAAGKVIDALMLHGELSPVQLKVAGRMGTSTVSFALAKLNGAGLLTKNGGKYSLKQI